MIRWFAIAGICACACLLGRGALGQVVADDDQVMAARVAAEYLLAQDTGGLARQPVFLVALSRSDAHDGAARVERRWDSVRWAQVEEGMRGRVASGARPIGADRRAAQAFRELVVTPPVVTADSAEVDASLCRVRQGGAACTGILYTLSLRREGGAWKVVSARVVGAS